MATRLQAIIDFVYRGGGVDQATTALGRLSQTGTDIGKAWGAIATPLNQTIQIFEQVGQAAQQAYQFISEGTQLSRTQDQFAALAGSIGTTSDMLMGQLRAATRGTVADFDLMTGASSLVSLGLTNTAEDTVRLTKLIGQLGWDMNQVTLTLANQSTMRLDALGLSVNDVTGRVDALKAAGMAADEAFKFAIIEAGEEKLRLLGDVAETTAGKLQILEANAKNFGDTFKATFSEELITNINAVAGGVFETQEGSAQLGESLAKIATNVSFLGFIRKAKEEIAELREEQERTYRVTGMGGVMERTPVLLDKAAESAKGFTKEIAASRDAVIAATSAVDGWAASLNTADYSAQTLSATINATAADTRAAANYFGLATDKITPLGTEIFKTELILRKFGVGVNQDTRELEDMYYATTQVTEGTEDLGAAIPTVTGAIYASTEAIAAYTAATGDYVTMAINAGDEGVNLNQVMYDSLDAAGGSAEALVGLALATGQLTEAQAENILKQAAMIEYAKGLGEQIAADTISINDAVTALSDFQAGLDSSGVAVNNATGSVILMNDNMVSAASSTQTLLDKFGAFPDEVGTTVNVDTTEAENRISSLEARLAGLGSGGQPGFASGGIQNPETSGPGFATGADFIVPPGYPNDSYPMRVQSGEHVTVTPAGQTRGGDTYNLYVTAMDGGANVRREINYLKALAGA